MRKFLLFNIFFLLIVGILGCSKQDHLKSFDELINGEIEAGSELSLTGKVAFFSEIDEKDELENSGVTEFEIDGPTQVLALVDENSKTVTVYNELDVTDEEVSKDELVTIKGKVFDDEESEKSIIKATDIERK